MHRARHRPRWEPAKHPASVLVAPDTAQDDTPAIGAARPSKLFKRRLDELITALQPQQCKPMRLSAGRLANLYRAQLAQCAFSGLPMRLEADGEANDAVGLDLINPSHGLVSSNVRLVCWPLAQARQQMLTNRRRGCRYNLTTMKSVPSQCPLRGAIIASYYEHLPSSPLRNLPLTVATYHHYSAAGDPTVDILGVETYLCGGSRVTTIYINPDNITISAGSRTHREYGNQPSDITLDYSDPGDLFARFDQYILAGFKHRVRDRLTH